ncbi:hypothetical protein [Streptomyces roseifaciens]|uniref:hypothetical protein n=1 Tax=Streptomyces roseifaciens TaxID=1488406 RepID=UPI000A4F5B2C|nr:hypothetical protein [Streptomyces roseifaciens]
MSDRPTETERPPEQPPTAESGTDEAPEPTQAQEAPEPTSSPETPPEQVPESGGDVAAAGGTSDDDAPEPTKAEDAAREEEEPEPVEAPAGPKDGGEASDEGEAPDTAPEPTEAGEAEVGKKEQPEDTEDAPDPSEKTREAQEPTKPPDADETSRPKDEAAAELADVSESPGSGTERTVEAADSTEPDQTPETLSPDEGQEPDQPEGSAEADKPEPSPDSGPRFEDESHNAPEPPTAETAPTAEAEGPPEETAEEAKAPSRSESAGDPDEAPDPTEPHDTSTADAAERSPATTAEAPEWDPDDAPDPSDEAELPPDGISMPSFQDVPVEHSSGGDTPNPEDTSSLESPSPPKMDRMATVGEDGLSNRIRPPREGDTNYVVDDLNNLSDTITDIDSIRDGTLWEEKTATGQDPRVDVDKWINKHVHKKLDSYVRARPHMEGYEQAPLGLDFTQPGATPDFRAAVESGIKEWESRNPGSRVKVRWAE